jgi:AcrR family transcriptional regulator
MPASRAASFKPRKKPVQRRAAEAVAAILEAAARILERDGFAGYNTNAIAARAGVSIGSLYQYFPGKDALTVALIERETGLLVEEVAAARLQRDAKSGLLAVIRAAIAHQMRRPVLARLLDFEEQRLPVRGNTGRVANLVEATIMNLLSCCDFGRAPDRPVFARDILAMVKGMVDAAGERGETDPRDLERRVRRAVFGYLGWKTPPLTPATRTGQ